MIDSILAGCTAMDGFHAVEQDLFGPFRWSEGKFRLQFPRPNPYVLIECCYHGAGGRLLMWTEDGRELPALDLHPGWRTYAHDFRSSIEGVVRFELNRVVRVEGDSRELGIMTRRVEVFGCSRRFGKIEAQLQNTLLNERERRAGATTLSSVPPRLRISMETRCNINPRCVYCEWDWAKSLEAGTETLSAEMLPALGPFYSHAREIVDCSYGEPFLNRDLARLVEDIDHRAKRFEMTTNALIMNEAKQDAVLGKHLTLYVSLDSATAEGFRALRNDDFDSLVKNVSRLCERKKLHGNRPTVIVSFIAMRSNIDEFPAFVELVARMGADAIKARSLYLEGAKIEEEVRRGGRAFRYQDEVLSMAELREFTRAARSAAQAAGVTLYVEADDFEKSVSGEDGPLCSEPWESIYVMNRGVMPCCFGKTPIASLEGVTASELGSFVGDLFNGPEYREIREALARRELPQYCRAAESCPIVKKHAG